MTSSYDEVSSQKQTKFKCMYLWGKRCHKLNVSRLFKSSKKYDRNCKTIPFITHKTSKTSTYNVQPKCKKAFSNWYFVKHLSHLQSWKNTQLRLNVNLLVKKLFSEKLFCKQQFYQKFNLWMSLSQYYSICKNSKLAESNCVTENFRVKEDETKKRNIHPSVFHLPFWGLMTWIGVRVWVTFEISFRKLGLGQH